MWTSHRRLVGALVGSLLLNVFLFGILFGHGVALHGKRPLVPAAGPLVPARNLKVLSEEQRQIFRAAMAVHRDAIRSARQTHRNLRSKTEADIAAPTFDRALVTSDFAALHRSNQAIDEAVSVALIDALVGLSPQARAALVARDAAAPDAMQKRP